MALHFTTTEFARRRDALLGAKFTPSWMDWPMFYVANDWQIVPGMVMFAHMILMVSASGPRCAWAGPIASAKAAPSPQS